MSMVYVFIKKKMLIISLVFISAFVVYATEQTLIGTAEGFGGELTVSVTLQEGQISAVKIEEHNETRGVGTRAIDALPKIIVEKNSTEIDVISGASYTSRAILEAVDNAIESSK